MLFVPVNRRAWDLAAARSMKRAVARKRGLNPFTPRQEPMAVAEDHKQGLHPVEQAIVACQDHSQSCPCVSERRRIRHRRKLRKPHKKGAAKLGFETWSEISKEDKTKHLSLKQCKKYGISYTEVSRPRDQNDMITNLRHLCLRFILLLKKKSSEYAVRYHDFMIPKRKGVLYSLVRSLSRKIRTVLPYVVNGHQNWKPLVRKDPNNDLRSYGSEFNSDQESDY